MENRTVFNGPAIETAVNSEQTEVPIAESNISADQVRAGPSVGGYKNGPDGRHYTLIFCRRKCSETEGGGDGSADEELLLGMKKRGVGMGKWNGFGGKIEQGESVEAATRRELMEECGVEAGVIEKRGYLVETVKSTNMKFCIHVYDCWEFSGTPTETSEMRPQWYRRSQLPWDSMWVDDQYLVPTVVPGG